ncbi:hypothetical protein K502DRAFT_363211 [Neoconidiobolus thromboides FSU 785]|nr:hypothetical protein K502DRAFT_363211 [Neoconidiobolus thromboides FSU 785]
MNLIYLLNFALLFNQFFVYCNTIPGLNKQLVILQTEEKLNASPKNTLKRPIKKPVFKMVMTHDLKIIKNTLYGFARGVPDLVRSVVTDGINGAFKGIPLFVPGIVLGLLGGIVWGLGRGVVKTVKSTAEGAKEGMEFDDDYI